MAETLFIWIFILASGVALSFCCLIIQDAWRQQRRKSSQPLIRPARRMSRTRGFDYPELFLEDIELRRERHEEAKETRA